MGITTKYPSTIRWSNFMSELLSTPVNIQHYLNTASQYEPENMRLAIETVLQINPDLAPHLIARYTHHLTSTDIKTLMQLHKT